MRILSQDGNIDIPYELVGLSISYIHASATNDTGEFCVNVHSNLLNASKVMMAKYSTEEKSKRVLEMLQNEYQYARRFETICTGTTDYPSQPNYYFQFPADDEVEV